MEQRSGLTRKELLALGGLAMIPLGAAEIAAASAETFAFDQARFETILAKPARHRQCCASTKASDAVLHTMVATMYSYEYDLHEGPGTVHEVGVLYHPAGVVLGLDDAVWNALLLPALPHLSAYYRTALDGLSRHGNPFLHRQSGASLEDDASIEALVSRGSHFFVCNNALLGLADSLATAHGMTSDAVHQRLLAGLVPGAMAVPSGVMAINACQEAHFTYIQVTL